MPHPAANLARSTSLGSPLKYDLRSIPSLHHTVKGEASVFLGGVTTHGYRPVRQCAVGTDKAVRIEHLKLALASRQIAQPERARYLMNQIGRGTVAYWSGLLAGDRSFGEKVARAIEDALGLPRAYLDGPGLSLEAMEVAEIYDTLDERSQNVLMATAHALIRPGPSAAAPPGAQLPTAPTTEPARRSKKLGA